MGRTDEAAKLAETSERALREMALRVGTHARRLRHDRGWNQDEAAWRSGIVVRMYQSLEAGRTNPTLRTVARLCAAFDVDPSELLAPAPPATTKRERGRPRQARK